MVVCDGLKGLPDAVEPVWPTTIVQTCIVHLLRNTFRLRRRKDWARSPRTSSRSTPAASEADARPRSPSSPRSGANATRRSSGCGTNAWAEFVPFLAFDVEIRKVICTTNAIESINARLRRAVNARGHFPTEQAA